MYNLNFYLIKAGQIFIEVSYVGSEL